MSRGGDGGLRNGGRAANMASLTVGETRRSTGCRDTREDLLAVTRSCDGGLRCDPGLADRALRTRGQTRGGTGRSRTRNGLIGVTCCRDGLSLGSAAGAGALLGAIGGTGRSRDGRPRTVGVGVGRAVAANGQVGDLQEIHGRVDRGALCCDIQRDGLTDVARKVDCQVGEAALCRNDGAHVGGCLGLECRGGVCERARINGVPGHAVDRPQISRMAAVDKSLAA